MVVPGPKTIRRGRQKQLGFGADGTPKTLTRFLPAALLSVITWSLLRYIVQPLFGSEEYYIDEEFHVPQARHYCRATFQKWNPKITTLPGLYLLSASVLVPCIRIYNAVLLQLGILNNGVIHDYDVCSLFALRAVNAVGAPACLYYAYYRCQLLLSGNEKKTANKEWSFIILAMSVAMFPVIYAPYSMLYYTDAWATASVFIWYSSHLSSKTNSLPKILLGGFSVLCRQTNIAWLVFASIIDVCQCIEEYFPTVKNSVSTLSYIQASITEILNCCTLRSKSKLKKLASFFKKCWQMTGSNLIVISLFISFVILFNNGDIVVGDRRAHIPRFHPMQLCYFMIFVLGFSLPCLLAQAYFKKRKSKSFTKRFKSPSNLKNSLNNIPKVMLILLLIVITGLLVYFNTIAHPYLLADNRHYTFYAWRLLFGPGKPVFLRYLPVPIYVFGLYFVDSKLTQTSIANKLAYWIVTPLILCAQFLLEPRYFVVPYFMYRLHTNKNNYTLKVVLVEFIAYQICNFIIMWVFLYRPFVSTMDNTGRLDRFTW